MGLVRQQFLGKEKAGGSSPPVGSIPLFNARRPMTGGVEVCHPTGTITINKVEDTVVTVMRTRTGHVHSGGTLCGGKYEHPALDPQVDELPRREGLAGGWRCWPMRVS